MEEAAPEQRTLSIEDLSDLREKTERVSAFLREELTTHLETLRPILAPRRYLGEHVRSGARDDLPGADRAFEQLKERFASACGPPFNLSKEFVSDPISLDGRLALYPWEYTLELGGDGKTITMTSPVKWVVSYHSGYTLAQLRKATLNKESLRPDDAREFVTAALALAGLGDLRYDIGTETCDGLGKLPLSTIRFCLPSFRPTDDLIRTATRFSGVPAFIELIDTEAVERLRDPLKERIAGILR
jgi:hypothetical protein